MRLFVAVVTIVLCVACREKRQLTMAKSNSITLALARCECEKLRRQEPPGDLTACNEKISRATRYLNINFEFNRFDADEKRAIAAAGDEAFKKCLAQ